MIGIAVSTSSLAWIFVFLAGVPAVTGLLFLFPQRKRLFLGLLAFVVCHVKKPWYMEVFFENYRGVDRGFGVTMADLLFFGMGLWLVLGGQRGKHRLVFWPWNMGPYVLLTLIGAASLIGSAVPYYGLFTLHKFLRGMVLYWVVVNMVRDREDLFAVLRGLFASSVFQLWMVLYGKYVTGEYVNRVVGSFPHPNSLAMYVDVITPIALAVLLVSSGRKWMDVLAAAAVMAGVVCVIFTKSRAALAIMSLTLVMAPPITFLLKPSKRQVGLMAAGLVVLSAIGAMAAPKIIKRFNEAPKESAETRVYFNHAALAMAADHPLGTGLNSYSWMLANTHYYWYVYPDKRKEVDNPREFRYSKHGVSRLGTCHHIYLLFAAETGWIGMYVFLLWISRFLLFNLVWFFRARDRLLKAILLGMLLGFWTLHTQGLLEWIFRQTAVFYEFFLVSGTLVAMRRMIPMVHAPLWKRLLHGLYQTVPPPSRPIPARA